jgi:cytochrome P450
MRRTLTEDTEPSGTKIKAGGAHFCLGANLARREIRLAFEELRLQIPDVVAITEPAILRSAFVHGIKRLQVGWTVPT